MDPFSIWAWKQIVELVVQIVFTAVITICFIALGIYWLWRRYH